MPARYCGPGCGVVGGMRAAHTVAYADSDGHPFTNGPASAERCHCSHANNRYGAANAYPHTHSNTQPGSDSNASPTPVPTPFWNQARVGEDGEPLPSCGDSIFTHPVVDPEDANPFFLGNKVYPHDHMVYWGTRKLYERDSPPAAGVPGVEQVQLYAPADIYFIEFWRIVLESHDGGTYEDWGITATICEGYSLGWGHVGRPVEEILGAFSKTVPIDQSDCPASTIEEALVTTEVGVCRWRVFFNPPIKAGTPVWKSSGYSAGFDFGLRLFGLTADELQQHPSYGYAINPWLHRGGNAVCTLDYFPEPQPKSTEGMTMQQRNGR